MSGMMSHEYLDRFCRFFTPCRSINRSNIGSAVFAHHSIDLYSMWLWAISAIVDESIMSGEDATPTKQHLDCSVIFTHHVDHSIGLSSVRPFCTPFNRHIQHVGGCCIDIVSGMKSNESAEQLDRFSRFCTTHCFDL